MSNNWFQAGISIVQGMVISSVLAGSALMASRMITTQKMAIKSAETKDHIVQLHKSIFSLLQNREHCLASLSSIVAGLTPGVAQTFNLTSLGANVGSGIGSEKYEVNPGTSYDESKTYMNGHVRIQSITLNTTTDLGDPQPIVINYRRLEKGQNTRTKSGFGGSSISKTVWIRMQRSSSASAALSGCYAVEIASDSDSNAGNSDLNREFCERLGTGGSLFTWDPTRNACVLKNNICPVKQVFEGIDVNGTAICRSINDYLPFLIKPGTNPCNGSKTVVAIVRDPSTNKVSIECY